MDSSAVPYQAYKPKRHSRTFSNSQRAPAVLAVSPSPPSSLTPSAPLSQDVQNVYGARVGDGSDVAPWNKPKAPLSLATADTTVTPPLSPSSPPPGPPLPPPPTSVLRDSSPKPAPNTAVSKTSSPSPSPSPSSSPSQSSSPTPPSLPTPAPSVNGDERTSPTGSVATSSSSPPRRPQSITSSSTSQAPIASRRISTFRHVSLRNQTSAPTSPSPLRMTGTHTRVSSMSSPRQFESALSPGHLSRNRLSGQFGPSSSGSPSRPVRPSTPSDLQSAASIPTELVHPIARVPSKSLTSSPVRTPSASLTPATSPQPRASSSTARTLMPYRPGFQPNGVYRPRTDNFLELRAARRDVGRVERTRLERRLEKLINLHFSSEPDEKEKEKAQAPRATRRMSSFFEIDFRNVDAGDLWRGVVSRSATPGSKADIRAQEQSITYWEKDADVTHCPMCSAPFHPITNRKHHCRLCGKIVCSLPIRRPQRPVLCSILFVADRKTGKIEEVGEGVDYGVRKRTMSTTTIRDELSAEEKFLKGVRICRDCRPVLMRKQFAQEATQTPTFARLCAALIELESEIEEVLPIFEELLHSLKSEEPVTQEAANARKRLVESFSHYDAVAKRIRQLPNPGPGSSQDRVQAAVASRANAFLQKHMVPLQSIPIMKPGSVAPIEPVKVAEPDLDAATAHALQPLLEQEALLETFVEEAKARRKFEDVRTLKTNLAEIRREINRVMNDAPAG